MTELTATCVFEAVKAAWRQTDKGYSLTLVLHPNEVPSEIQTSPIGTRYYVGITRADEQASITDNRAVQAAGLLCRNPDFRAYLRSRGLGESKDENGAASILRSILKVDSRSKIMGASAEKMMEIADDFRTWHKSHARSAPSGKGMEDDLSL